MKRQDSLPSSSSHRENKNNNNNTTEKLHAKAVGCMSGLFHFVSGYRNSRKFLTFGKKHEKKEVTSNNSSSNGKSSYSSITTTTTKSSSIDKEGTINTTCSTNVIQRFSCEVPRSPTLPAEIRRSNSVNSPQNFRAPPALVARLMGLEEVHSTMTKAMQLPEYSSAAEKRRQLLGALEKCDQDLKALKKIIDAVRSAEQLQSPATTAFGSSEGYHDSADHGRKRFQGMKGLEVNNAEQPSPVSVLDELTRSPLSNFYQSKRQSFSYGRVQHQVRQQKKKPAEADFISPSIFDRITCESLHRKAAGISIDLHHVDITTSSSPTSLSLSSSPLWSSEAMKESVEEVCKDIAWGERREIGRIGLALQDHICRDLVEELVTDLSSFHSYNNLYSSLPFEACKRRLCF